jgi:hypothetical protein
MPRKGSTVKLKDVVLSAVVGLPIWWTGWQLLDVIKTWVLR